MKEVRFAFYLARFEWRNVFKKGKKLHVVDDVISWWTWLFNWFTPGYSHVEVWIPETDKMICWPPAFTATFTQTGDVPARLAVYGTVYTSTMRGDENGTVSRPASTVFTNPKRWHYLEFEVTDESFAEAKAWADERVAGKHKYAMKDIRRFFMPLWLLRKLKWDDPEREICTEHAEGWAIRLVDIVFPITLRHLLHRILIRSPRRLWRDLVRRHHVPTYLLATDEMVIDNRGKRVK